MDKNFDSLKLLEQKSTLVESRDYLSENQTQAVYGIRLYQNSENATDCTKNEQEQCVYLNLIMRDGSSQQTACSCLRQGAAEYRITTRGLIQKIEVIEYDQMKKVLKIGLKGVRKDFKLKKDFGKQNLSIEIVKATRQISDSLSKSVNTTLLNPQKTFRESHKHNYSSN